MAFEDIRKSRRWLSAEDIRFIILALIVFSAMLALNIYIASSLPGGEQFYMRWEGARAFLYEKIEPYGTTVAGRIQNVAYGRPAFSSEYPYVLNDPFYAVMMYVPLAALPELIGLLIRPLNVTVDFAVVRGLWLLLSEVAILSLMVAFLRSLEWQPARWLYAAALFMGFVNYYTLIALGSGSPAVMIALLVFGILFSLRLFFDELAGALLFLISYQWEVVALFFLYVIFFVLANRRWKVFSGFAMSMVIVITISFLVYPGWILPYVGGVLSDWQRGVTMTFIHVTQTWFQNLNFTVGFWIPFLLGIALIFEWFGSIDGNYRRLAWVACLSLALNPLMGFAIFPTNHVVLVPVFLFILVLSWERWSRRKGWMVIFGMIISFFLPFVLYVRVLDMYEPILVDLLTVLPPISAIIGLYWMRWWAFRTSRTWSDQIGAQK